MEPKIKIEKMPKLNNAALDWIRYKFTEQLGAAVALQIQNRLINEGVGEDGKPVRTGGFLTGEMWRTGWRTKPRGKGTRSYFGGSSLSSKWLMNRLEEGMSREAAEDKEKAIRKNLNKKRRAAHREKLKGLREMAKIGAATIKGRRFKATRMQRVQNRIKAASVQYGHPDGNSDFASRTFLGLTVEEAQCALAYIQDWMVRNSLDTKGLGKLLNNALAYEDRLAEDLRRRIRNTRK